MAAFGLNPVHVQTRGCDLSLCWSSDLLQSYTKAERRGHARDAAHTRTEREDAAQTQDGVPGSVPQGGSRPRGTWGQEAPTPLFC